MVYLYRILHYKTVMLKSVSVRVTTCALVKDQSLIIIYTLFKLYIRTNLLRFCKTKRMYPVYSLSFSSVEDVE